MGHRLGTGVSGCLIGLALLIYISFEGNGLDLNHGF